MTALRLPEFPDVLDDTVLDLREAIDQLTAVRDRLNRIAERGELSQQTAWSLAATHRAQASLRWDLDARVNRPAGAAGGGA
jgi:hypothetical protein